jgi:hypothetical protein
MTQKYLKSPDLQGVESNPIGYIRWQSLYLDSAAKAAAQP